MRTKNRKAANKKKPNKTRTPKEAPGTANLKAPKKAQTKQKDKGKGKHGFSSTTYKPGCTKSEEWTSEEKVSISKVSRIVKVIIQKKWYSK